MRYAIYHKSTGLRLNKKEWMVDQDGTIVCMGRTGAWRPVNNQDDYFIEFDLQPRDN